jgi:hypothetical protein
MISFNSEKKSPLLAFIKFKPIFFQVLWQFFNPKGSLSQAGGREIRYEKKSISIVDIEVGVVLQHHPGNGHHMPSKTHQRLAL